MFEEGLGRNESCEAGDVEKWQNYFKGETSGSRGNFDRVRGLERKFVSYTQVSYRPGVEDTSNHFPRRKVV